MVAGVQVKGGGKVPEFWGNESTLSSSTSIGHSMRGVSCHSVCVRTQKMPNTKNEP